jgi:hypothetical protein
VRRLALFVAAAAAALVVTVVAIAAASGGDRSLKSTLAPSVPTDPTFHGVAPGGAPWVLSRGSVTLSSEGRLDLTVKGLIIPTLGNPGPVTSISASLFCGGDTSTTPAATTGTEPLSSAGDGAISERVTLPANCLAPIVLVNPNGIQSLYIAVTGWKMSA